MKAILGVLSVSFMIADAYAEIEKFDGVQVGALPPGWIAGATGLGAPQWTVEVSPRSMIFAMRGGPRNNR